MGKLNKFFYAKGASKRGVLLAADRINGVEAVDANTLGINFDNLGNHRDTSQGEFRFDFSPSGSVQDFVSELFSASAKNPFTVIADSVNKDGVADQYAGGTVSIYDVID